MTTITIFDEQSGAFGRVLRLPASAKPETQLRPGESYKVGVYDKHSQRVEMATGAVVDYIPPPPDADHEWDLIAKRYRKRVDVLRAEAADTQARERIAELEQSKLRALTDHVLSPDVEVEIGGRRMLPKDRVAELEAAIAELRKDLAPSRRDPG